MPTTSSIFHYHLVLPGGGHLPLQGLRHVGHHFESVAQRVHGLQNPVPWDTHKVVQ